VGSARHREGRGGPGTLVAVAPTVGMAHVVSATAGMALGLGYDVDQALEVVDEP